ncbi:MAG: hypothetical protein K2M79_03085 [Muribaculaceae bacterium]|nr:hypothetical protein [Muribaculaceae bacterium]
MKILRMSGLLALAQLISLPAMADVTVRPVNDHVIYVQVSRGATVAENLPAAKATLSNRTEAADGTVSYTTAAGVRVSYNAAADYVQIGATPAGTIICNGLTSIAGAEQLRIYRMGTGQMYGAGERGHKMDLSGEELVNYNRQNYGYTGTDPRISQMNITMPLVVTTDGYALLFDDYAPSTLDLNNPLVYTTEASGPLSFYYVQGNSLAEVTSGLSAVTGRQALPPMWTLGYITSKYGYRDQAETEGTIDTLKRRDYPVDGIVLDLYWYGKEQDMGRLEWDPVQWPAPEKMLSDLRKKGVNVVTISQPYVLRNGRGVENYNNLAPRGLFVADSTGTAPQEVTIWVGEGGMWDVSNPETRAWLARRYSELLDMGVAGLWGDLGEPEVHPQSGLHANGLSARRYHNKYGNDWSSIIYDMWREKYPDSRPMLMMRGGTTGLQQYSVFPWSTDVSRSWGGMEPQVRIMLHSGLSGLGYMGHDVGGFAIDAENPTDPELYVRWLQLGLFSPMLRTHAQQYAEPYNYPEQENIIRDIIKERYRWLPYNYTLAMENHTKGYPMVRPINFQERTGENITAQPGDEYLWGKDVLVAPVFTQGATARMVVFPRGTVWYDYNAPQTIYKAPADSALTVSVSAPLERLPLFVRAGSFIPQAGYKMGNTGHFRRDVYDLKYYYSPAESHGMLYDDNRSGVMAAEAEGYTIDFTATPAGEGMNISLSTSARTAVTPAKVTFNFTVYGMENVKKIQYSEGTSQAKAVKWTYDAATGAYTARIVYNTGRKGLIQIVK